MNRNDLMDEFDIVNRLQIAIDLNLEDTTVCHLIELYMDHIGFDSAEDTVNLRDLQEYIDEKIKE